MNDDPEGPDGSDDDFEDDHDDEGFEEGFDEPLDEHETALVQQDLTDLADFEAAFRAEGYRGVAVWCHDCVEEHYFPWEMLRENLRMLLETGETPVHEPAFQPEPDRYVPWDYARGYVDALRDLGVTERAEASDCWHCGFHLPQPLGQGNFCPRCGTPLLTRRLSDACRLVDLTDDQAATLFLHLGLPRPPDEPA